MLQPHNIRMSILHQLSHYLQLPILKPFILQHLLDGHDLPRFDYRRLEDHAEGSVPYDAFGGVRDGFWT